MPSSAIGRLGKLSGRVTRIAIAPNTNLVLSGFAGGMVLLMCLHFVFASLGTTLVATTCVVAALLIGTCAGFRLPHSRGDAVQEGLLARRFSAVGQFGASNAVLAALTLLVPWLADFVWRVAEQVPVGAVHPMVIEVPVFALTTFLVLALPVTVLAKIPLAWDLDIARTQQPRTKPDSTAVSSEWGLPLYFACLSVGVLFGAIGVVPNTSLDALKYVAFSLLVLIVLADAGRRFSRIGHSQVRETPRSAFDARRVESAIGPRPIPGWPLIGLGMGLVLAAVSRFLHQLMPVSSWVVAMEWATVLGSVSVGLWWAQRFQSHRDAKSSGARASTTQNPTFYGLLLVCSWPVILVAGFPLLTGLSLWNNATISEVSLSVVLRLMIVVIAITPLCFGYGILISSFCSGDRRSLTLVSNDTQGTRCEFVRMLRWHCLAAACGFLVCRWSLLQSLGVAASLIAGSWLLLAVAVWHCWRGLGSMSRLDANRWLTAAVGCVVVASPCWRGNYDPARSARLLFDTTVFQARRSGLPAELLPCLDEGRYESVSEGERSTFSIWRRHSVTEAIRESGILKSIISTDPRIVPHYAPEMLHAILPMVLHERPFRVLLLGLGGGNQLTACLAFPAQEVVCVEPDRQVLEIVKAHSPAWDVADPLRDERLRLYIAEPACAVVSCGSEPFDVIIGNPDAPSLMQAAPCWTIEYLRRVSKRLSEQGIFCQRFQSFDCAVESVQVITRTFQEAFRQVVLFEPAPGEMLFVATNAPQGLLRPGLTDRLQAPHVQSLLAETGADWSELADVATYPHQALLEIADSEKTPTNTIHNGALAFGMPFEVMRWGAKRREVMSLLSSCGQSLHSLLGEDGNTPEIERRLNEIAIRHELQMQHPDQYWLYRKKVKEQLTEHGRSTIRLVSGESPRRERHWEDQQRLDYFETLDEASREPTPARLEALAAFSRTTDPLLSHFVHHEAAAIWARAPHRDVEKELTHRLHAIYFASSTDRSLRDVIAALELLCEHPDAAPDPIQRWDHFNSLLQTLAIRWQNRRAVPPTSTRVVLNDIDQSVLVLQTSFQVMDSLTEEAGVPAEVWEGRRQWVERVLVRPLRTYRSRILPHHDKERKKEQVGTQG